MYLRTWLTWSTLGNLTHHNIRVVGVVEPLGCPREILGCMFGIRDCRAAWEFQLCRSRLWYIMEFVYLVMLVVVCI